MRVVHLARRHAGALLIAAAVLCVPPVPVSAADGRAAPDAPTQAAPAPGPDREPAAPQAVPDAEPGSDRRGRHDAEEAPDLGGACLYRGRRLELIV